MRTSFIVEKNSSTKSPIIDLIKIAFTRMTVICVTTAAAVEMCSEVKDRVCVLVAEMEVACSLRVESVPIVSVSRD